MTKQFILSPTASRDLEAIFDYFFERSVDSGESFIAQFNRKCRNIANFPNMGRSYENLGANLRGIPLNGYIILYRVTEKRVKIVRVVSGYQDLDNLSLEVDNEFLESGDE